MGLQVTAVGIPDDVKSVATPAAAAAGNKSKNSYSTKDLDLTPAEISAFKKLVMGIVFSWASTIEDFFSVNSNPDLLQVLRESWDDYMGGVPYTSTVLKVVSTAQFFSSFVIAQQTCFLGGCVDPNLEEHDRQDRRCRCP